MKVLSHYLRWRMGLARAQTQTTCAEQNCIVKHVRGKHCVVEIGVWHGVTTNLMRAAMARDGVLFAIDPYPVGRLGISLHQRIAHAEVAKVPGAHLKWIRKSGAEALNAAKANGLNQVDFIFIDGDHSFKGLQLDWELWNPWLAPMGVAALHDSRSTSARDIEEAGSVIYTRQHILCDMNFEVLEQVDSLTVLRRQHAR
jgi:predicted O-methyltransferase YrrM